MSRSKQKRLRKEERSMKHTVYDRAAGATTTHKLDPAQERGERVESGKAIARGGKTSGDVPGASE